MCVSCIGPPGGPQTSPQPYCRIAAGLITRAPPEQAKQRRGMYQGVCRLKFTCRIRFCYSFCRRESRNMRFYAIYFKSPRVVWCCARAFSSPHVQFHIFGPACALWSANSLQLYRFCLWFFAFSFLRTHSSRKYILDALKKSSALIRPNGAK